MSSGLFLSVSVLKAVVEIAAMSLLAQHIIGALAGDTKADNFVYRLFQVISAPWLKLCRAILPQRHWNDTQLGWLASLLLLLVWLALVFAKAAVCHAQQLVCVA